ncbi:hypothetical protein H4S06_004396 [Coemansia sp. BCRC 34490]|nr:hypothetical protein H4S06_004396 [Coemansia sp. BCRC 34490]
MYGRTYDSAAGAFDEDEDERLYQQQGSSSGGDSDGIDSDVEEKILSHLYYQSNKQATSSAPTPTQPPRVSTPVPARRRVSGQQQQQKKKKSLETEESGDYDSPASRGNEDQGSKYSIGSSNKRRRQDTRWKLSDLAAPAYSEQSAEQMHSSGEEGEISGSQNEHAVAVTMVPAYRKATNSDDYSSSEDETTDRANGTRTTLPGRISTDQAVSYNASDDDAVNDYLDNVASSGLATPPNAAPTTLADTNGLAGVSAADHDMEHQLIKVDTLLSPGAKAYATDALLHDVPVKSSLGAEDNEYDYLDEAEIQGRNRYFMEEKEIICRRCHKPGHISKECTTVTCMVCGNEGHTSKDCKLTGNVCHRCNMRGHIAADCPQQQQNQQRRPGSHRDRGRAAACDRCNMRTHHTDECPTIWRRYVYAGHRPVKYKDVRPWCYNCSRSGHFGDDCSVPRGRGANAFLGNTAFNSNNCMGRCIGNSTQRGQHPDHHRGADSHSSNSRSSHKGGRFAAKREERRRDTGHDRRDWRNHKDSKRRSADSSKRRAPGSPGRKSSRPKEKAASLVGQSSH